MTRAFRHATTIEPGSEAQNVRCLKRGWTRSREVGQARQRSRGIAWPRKALDEQHRPTYRPRSVAQGAHRRSLHHFVFMPLGPLFMPMAVQGHLEALAYMDRLALIGRVVAQFVRCERDSETRANRPTQKAGKAYLSKSFDSHLAMIRYPAASVKDPENHSDPPARSDTLEPRSRSLAMRILVDGVPVETKNDENLLVALLRAGLHPTGGGCLCLDGDCPHCLATVDGISYVRTCQTRCQSDLEVERHHLNGDQPPLFAANEEERPTSGLAIPTRHVHCDVAVLGLGPAGQEAAQIARDAGKEVATLDAGDGKEVVGIYVGPLVIARSGKETLQFHVREEVVVATGAAEIQPVVPGNDLAGLLTARAATRLAAAGLDLGQVVAVGTPPEGVAATPLHGELIRFEGVGRVEAVVVRDQAGKEHRHVCDTVSLALGFHPRDALFRMGRDLDGVRVIGDAARESDIPPCPREGTVCPCGGVEVSDLESVWERGFHELELVKRATLAGTGTCQGSACLPHIRSFLQERGKELQPPFTARPVTRQLTLGEIASGAFHHPTPRTPLHQEHLALGAQMERAGGWWRPWTYGDEADEYAAVRERVSIGDVSTLGKFVVSGRDSEAFLDFLYPTRVATIKPGQSRYVLLLDERGYVLDDGMICRDSQSRWPCRP